MNPEIRAIAFDFDGTLVDSNAIKRGAFYKVLSPYVAEAVIDDELTSHPLRDRRSTIRACLAISGQAETLTEQLTEDYTRQVHTAITQCAIMPGTELVLEKLTRIFPCFLVSATPQTPLRAIVHERGWDAHFMGIWGKPNLKPDLLRRIITQLSIIPASLLMVGDQPSDREASVAVKCRFYPVGDAKNDIGQTGNLLDLTNDLINSNIPEISTKN